MTIIFIITIDMLSTIHWKRRDKVEVNNNHFPL